MTALLCRDPTRPRRARHAAGGIAAVAVLATLLASCSDADPCGGAAARLGEVWRATRRDAVRAAFRASGRPYAKVSLAIVERELDRYTKGWIASQTDACKATHSRGEHLPQRPDLRMPCLDERRDDLGALVDRLASADATVVENASRAARLLPALGACDDGSQTGRPSPPVDDRIRGRVAELHAELAAARALRLGGLPARARDALRALADKAAATGYRPLEAQVLDDLSRAHLATGDLSAAEEANGRAALAAEAGRHDRLAARIAIARVEIVGIRQRRLDEADALLERARAAVEPVRPDPTLGAELDAAEGDLLEARGMWEASIDPHRRALALYRRLGADHPGGIESHIAVGRALFALGRHAEAIAIFEEVRAQVERVEGKEHPDSAAVLNHLAAAYLGADRYKEAAAALTRAIAIMEATLGAAHAELAGPLVDLATADVRLGRYPAALSHAEKALGILTAAGAPPGEMARAQAILATALTSAGQAASGAERWRLALAAAEKAYGTDHPMVSAALVGLADALIRQGLSRDAVPFAERALTAAQKDLPADRRALARILGTNAMIQVDLGRLDRGRALYLRALAIQDEESGPEHIDTAETLRFLSRVDRIEKKYVEGRAHLERAVPVLRRVYGDAHWTTILASSELADVMVVTGDPAGAVEIYRHNIPLIAAVLGPNHKQLAFLLTPMGQALERLDRLDEARQVLERALRVGGTMDPTNLAEIRFSLARVLPSRELVRARELARQALAAYRAGGRGFRSETRDIDVWLGAHRGPRAGDR